MSNEVKVKFNAKRAILEVRISSYNDILRDGRLEDQFLSSLFEGYRAVDNSEKKRRQRSLPPLKRAREAIRKNKEWSELPISEIHLYPKIVSEVTSENVKDVIIKSIGLESEYSRIMADRWELFEDISVGADLLIDISAMSVGVHRFIITGELREGITGFGYLAIVGMALLITYFIFRIAGEEPCKRKNRYLTHILRTPMTLHRSHPAESDMTFSANSEYLS